MTAILILDGATGTNLYDLGLPPGVATEKWVLENPDKFKNLQSDFVKSGSQVLYAPTFGANSVKLASNGIAEDVVSINKKLVSLSLSQGAFVAGGLSPTGEMMSPLGNCTFDEIVDVYKEQIKGMGDVDLFVIETMLDLKESLAALTAVKDLSDKPVFVTLTFENNGLTLMGNSPESVILTLQEKGASAVGVNCGNGPELLLSITKKMSPFALVPLIAKPNAGLPVVKNGKTEYDLSPDEFVAFTSDFINSGVYILGGCCGTKPAHISKLSESIPKEMQKASALSEVLCQHSGSFSNSVTSLRKVCFLDNSTISPKTDIDDAFDLSFDFDIINVDVSNTSECELKDFLLESSFQNPIVFSGANDEQRMIINRYYMGRTKFYE